MQVIFRHESTFGTDSRTVAVHQIVESGDDVDNALYNAERDGFEVICLYVADLEDAEFYAGDLPPEWRLRFDTCIRRPALSLVK